MVDEDNGSEVPSDHTPAPRVVSFLLADRAEVSQNKLYVMGGNVDTFVVQGFPAIVQFGVATVTEVPYGFANKPVELIIIFEDQAGSELARVGVVMIAGRPDWLPLNVPQRIPFAVPQILLNIQAEGTYTIRSLLAGHSTKHMSFQVRSAETSDDAPQ